MSFHRYERSHFIFKNYLNSKFLYKKYKNNPFFLNSIYISAGLFTPSEVSLEHGHILSTLTGKPFSLVSQWHGKRKKRTISLDSQLYKNFMWKFIDKFLYQFLGHSYEFETPKQWRSKQKYIHSFTFKVREKFRLNKEYELLFENFMYDTHRGKFLPLVINLNIKRSLSNIILENYIHMLQFPCIWYKRRVIPAFDDSAPETRRWKNWWVW